MQKKKLIIVVLLVACLAAAAYFLLIKTNGNTAQNLLNSILANGQLGTTQPPKLEDFTRENIKRQKNIVIEKAPIELEFMDNGHPKTIEIT